MRKLFPLALAILALGGCSSSGQKNLAVSPAEAGIPFTEFGDIFDYRADGSTGIYIETDDRKWYHATFLAPCLNLSSTEHVGVRTTPPLPLTKFDSIEVRGEDCYFKTIEQVPSPPASRPAKP